MPEKVPRNDTAADCRSEQADSATAFEHKSHPSLGSGVNKENQQLEVGFKVLHKVKGHQYYWQAKVTEVDGNRYLWIFLFL